MWSIEPLGNTQNVAYPTLRVVRAIKMVQVLKSAQDSELFGGLGPGTVRASTQKFKSQSDFGQMRHFQPRNCRF
jgi:hypothetical protein